MEKKSRYLNESEVGLILSSLPFEYSLLTNLLLQVPLWASKVLDIQYKEIYPRGYGKGKRMTVCKDDVECTIPRSCSYILNTFAKWHTDESGPYLFITSDGRRITCEMLRRRYRIATRKTGIPCDMSSIRKTWAMNALSHGKLDQEQIIYYFGTKRRFIDFMGGESFIPEYERITNGDLLQAKELTKIVREKELINGMIILEEGTLEAYAYRQGKERYKK